MVRRVEDEGGEFLLCALFWESVWYVCLHLRGMRIGEWLEGEVGSSTCTTSIMTTFVPSSLGSNTGIRVKSITRGGGGREGY